MNDWTAKIKKPLEYMYIQGVLFQISFLNYNLALNSLPALNLATFLALILIVAPV